MDTSEKLYKITINIRYHSQNTQWYDYAIKQTQIIKQQSIKEFIRNKYISLSKRMGLLLFLYIPITYNCFMYINELIYKLKK